MIDAPVFVFSTEFVRTTSLPNNRVIPNQCMIYNAALVHGMWYHHRTRQTELDLAICAPLTCGGVWSKDGDPARWSGILDRYAWKVLWTLVLDITTWEESHQSNVDIVSRGREHGRCSPLELYCAIDSDYFQENLTLF